jgi:hypothetical protein
VKKRNEQSTAGGAFHPAIFHPLPISHPGPISHRDRFPIGTDFPSGRFPIRLTDARTGRPYGGSFSVDWTHPGDFPSGWRTPRPGVPTVIIT